MRQSCSDFDKQVIAVGAGLSVLRWGGRGYQGCVCVGGRGAGRTGLTGSEGSLSNRQAQLRRTCFLKGWLLLRRKEDAAVTYDSLQVRAVFCRAALCTEQ